MVRTSILYGFSFLRLAAEIGHWTQEHSSESHTLAPYYITVYTILPYTVLQFTILYYTWFLDVIGYYLFQAVSSMEDDWRQQNVEEYFRVEGHLRREQR